LKIMLPEKCKNIFLSSWFSYLLIIFLGSLIYFKSLFFDFTYLDDNVWILDYQWFLKNIHNCFHLFTHPDFISKSFYRPVLTLSFMLDAQWSGTSPFGYRLTDLGIHLLSSCLLLNILKRLKYSQELALSFALIFTVHPVFTQAVAWIPGRTDSLLGLFVLSSFIFFLSFLDRKQWSHYAGHVFFLILALLTKETAVVLPVICFLYLYLIHETKIPKIKYLVSWFIILAVWGIIRTKIVMATNDITLSHAVMSLFQNLPALIPYIGKVFLPLNLSVLPILEDMSFVYGWISIGIITLLLLFSKNKRGKYVFFGLLWFLVFLLPSLVVSFLKHEYRLYLPMIGCMIVLLETDLIKRH